MNDTSTYTLDQIASAVGVKPRTIRHWIARGLLPAPRFKGASTRYNAAVLLRARVVAQLRAQNEPLRAIHRRLASVAPEDLAALLPTEPTYAPRTPAPLDFPTQLWDRVVLAPGLELLVAQNAGPLVRRAAQDIHTHYGPART